MFTEAYTEALLATSRDPILIMDGQLQIIKASTAFCRQFSLPEKSIEAQPLYQIQSGVWDTASIHNLFEELAAGNDHTEDYETQLDFPQLGQRNLLLNARLWKTHDGQVLYFLAIEDVTEKRVAQQLQQQIGANLEREVQARTQELEQSRAFLNAILGSTYYGIASYEPVRKDGEVIDFRVAYTNQEVPGNFGLSVQDVRGKTLHEVYPGVFENGIFEKIRECLLTGVPGSYEIKVDDDGHEIWLTAALERINDTVTITSKNITAEKSAALELERINTLLSNKNKELSSFTYVASHDLQEPLRKIRMFISRILDEEKTFSDNTLAYFNNINATAVRMQALIDALLSYSSMDSDELRTERTDLNKFLREILSLMDVQLEESGAKVVVANLPTVQVIRIQFQQLLLNVLNNAIKYRKPGIAPQIDISAEKIERGTRKYWQLTISDNGIGFDPQYADKIFEVFQRLHGKREYEGTGVGLAICKKIMQNLHGDIWAEAVPGQGARFHILIPTKS